MVKNEENWQGNVEKIGGFNGKIVKNVEKLV